MWTIILHLPYYDILSLDLSRLDLAIGNIKGVFNTLNMISVSPNPKEEPNIRYQKNKLEHVPVYYLLSCYHLFL